MGRQDPDGRGFRRPLPARALIATLDEQDPDPRMGDLLPPLWHWLYFLEAAPQSRIGPDGHAERGEFLPPVPLPRRMWAGSRFTFDGSPLRIGETVSRVSTIKSVEPKTGSTGSMVFVTVKHTVSGAGGAASSRNTTSSIARPPSPARRQREPKPAPTDATWSKTVMPDPVLLFRFSALTFNGHRIHYDQPYVTGDEGYPGLIVHGPLLGLLQIELARRANPGKTPASFEFRALSPVLPARLSPCRTPRRRRPSRTWIANAKGGLAQQGKAYVPMTKTRAVDLGVMASSGAVESRDL